MAYSQIPYSDPTSFSPYTKLPADRAIDPEIKRSVSPASTADYCTVQRYLLDKNKSSFFGYSTIDSVLPGTVGPIPPSHFQRTGSPSYTNSSSSCSSALSPPRDTDYCQVHSPLTPSDAALTSQYENWGPYPQAYELTGLADGCVNPGDVNSMQDIPVTYCDDSTPVAYGDDNIQRFNLPSRTCSMSSDDNNNNTDVWRGSEIASLPRDASPDTPNVKEEIHVPDTVGPYSHFDPQDGVDSEEDAESPYLKSEPIDDNEDDDEYSPYKKRKNGAAKPTRNTKSHKRYSTSQPSPDAKRPKLAIGDSLVVRSGTKPSIQGAKGQYTCSECHKLVSFKDQSGLDNHMRKQHTRPFTCVFDFADCRSTFASKNEWKRHCASQHLVLQYWVCQQDACAQVSNKSNTPKKASGSARRRASCPRSSAECAPAFPKGNRMDLYTQHAECASTLPNGTVFNRKDLYTQHLRRMHVPAHLKKQVKSKKHVQEWDDCQRIHQDEALRTRCQLPTHMLCPAHGCNVQFDGPTAWDDRMEHVAKHLEKAAAGTEPPVQFGENDDTLINWATSPAIGILRRGDKGKWILQNPLKSTGHAILAVAKDEDDNDDDEDADAEGEEVDE
ncbi:hypothetical protein F5Y19DRAFT_480585 [Xylariaceae sp. FL1651]|nr:hypothetical protein F5Y19DRAFT_480585 [Xylariaceae sp. FL1651]